MPQNIQAENLDILYNTSRTMGYVSNTTWFELQDVPAANLYFGLVDATGQPKQAFGDYATQAAIAPPTSPTPGPTPSPTGTPLASTTVSLTLQSGWNLIALPVSPTLPLQAQNVLAGVVAASGGSLAELASWQGSNWTTDLDSGGAMEGNNFTLEPGLGYFVYSDQASTLTVTGCSIAGAPTQTLTAGWNLIGLPTASGGQTASALLSNLTAEGRAPLEVASWTGTGWQTLVQTAPGAYLGTDFTLSPQQGYFVYVQNSGSWPALAP